MRVAVVHYWLVSWRGGEKVLDAILGLFPGADLFTHVADPDVVRAHLGDRAVTETFIGRLPNARSWYQRYLPLMPLALEQLDLRRYDLVISCESGPAKGVIVGPNAVHVCYCHSPMRYVWDMYHDYREEAGWLTRRMMAPLLHYVRMWDQLSAQRVDHFVANSRFVATRIGKYYRREAEVIHPPVAVDEFSMSAAREDFYLFVGQLAGYKRADLAVRAFNRLGLPLVVVGDGEQQKLLRRIAGPNVRILGRQASETIRDLYARCRAVVFPGVEDFGIVPLEAMASGKPVVAFRAGGALETVRDGDTGLFFDVQSPEALAAAVERIESEIDRFDPVRIRRHAESFGPRRFDAEMRAFLDRALAGAGHSRMERLQRTPRSTVRGT